MNMNDIVKHYHEYGYAIVDGLLNAQEVNELQAVTDRIVASAADLSDETPVFDFEPRAPGAAPTIQRIKKPHRVDPYFASLMRHPRILEVLKAVIGPDIRLNHSKINMKAARVGAALEWHQDWAFAPHTNMSTCVASVLIDPSRPENGAMQVLSGSHKGPLIEHHDEDGYFIGAVDPNARDVNLASAKAILGAPGTVAFHHPLTIHGSGVNRSGESRRILFLEYAAADAFPLFYAVEWEEYESRMVAGKSSSEIRIEPHRVKLPFPSRAGSSIYKIQANAKAKFFATAT